MNNRVEFLYLPQRFRALDFGRRPGGTVFCFLMTLSADSRAVFTPRCPVCSVYRAGVRLLGLGPCRTDDT